MTSLPTIAILGAGSMGGAILRGLVAGGAPDIRVTNRTVEKAAVFEGLEGVTSIALASQPNGNVDAVRGAKVVIVGVKPAMVVELLTSIRDALEPDAVVVSVAAGVTTAAMEAAVPSSVVRAMPNTPSLVGKGVTGVAAGSRATADDMALASSLFELVGDVIELGEDRIDALSTISGSGPAYVYFLIEQLTETALAMGFSAEEAATMVNGTFIGAAALLESSDVAPAELRRRVTSPGGTTERAVAVLTDAQLSELFGRATAAALARARELAG